MLLDVAVLQVNDHCPPYPGRDGGGLTCQGQWPGYQSLFRCSPRDRYQGQPKDWRLKAYNSSRHCEDLSRQVLYRDERQIFKASMRDNPTNHPQTDTGIGKCLLQVRSLVEGDRSFSGFPVK